MPPSSSVATKLTPSSPTSSDHRCDRALNAAQVRVEELLGRATEHRRTLRAPSERLDDADAGRRLLDDRRQVALLVLRLPGDLVVEARESVAHYDHGRAERDRDHREEGVDPERPGTARSANCSPRWNSHNRPNPTKRRIREMSLTARETRSPDCHPSWKSTARLWTCAYTRLRMSYSRPSAIEPEIRRRMKARRGHNVPSREREQGVRNQALRQQGVCATAASSTSSINL